MKMCIASERLISLTQFFAGAPSDIHQGCDPHFFVSPRTSSGAPTCGLAITLLPPGFKAAVDPIEYGNYYSGSSTPFPLPLSGGFSLVVYRALFGVGAGYYGKLKTLTGINYGDQLVLGDIGGGWGARFAVGNAGASDGGKVFLAIAELP